MTKRTNNMSTIYSFKQVNNKKIINVTKISQFFELALSLMNNEDYIYRGISHDNEKYPKVIREKDCSKDEISILADFERYYGLFAKTSNFWEFLAIAQHHGLMTRLIDFTTNFFVAAFFSLYQKSKKSVHKIFVLDKKKLKKSSEWKSRTPYASEPDEKMSDNVKLAFEELSKFGGNYVLCPDYTNNRIFVQQGLFVMPGSISEKHINAIYDNAEFEIIISKRVRIHILKKLKAIGFDEFRLMTDLDNVCRDINQSYLDKQ